MAGSVGHTGGLTNPRPWRGRYRAGCSNTGGPPLPRKRAPLQKKMWVDSECPVNPWLGISQPITYQAQHCLISVTVREPAFPS